MFTSNSNSYNTSVIVKSFTMPSMQIQRRISNKKVCTKVISPIFIHSPFSIPDSPQYISIENINKMTNISHLKKLEYEYDNFLEKKCQILMLLNVIDEVFDIRDTLIVRISTLIIKERYKKMKLDYLEFTKK